MKENENDEETTKKKKKKTTKKKSKKESLIPPNKEFDENKYLIYSSGEDCNMDGLRRAKKKPVGFSVYNEKKKLTAKDLMEDDHYCGMSFDGNEEESYFAIYDGYGGYLVANECRRLTPIELQKIKQNESLNQNNDFNEKHSNEMNKLFANIDEELHEDKFMDLGCTCTVVHVWKENEKQFVQSGNVGDSTCFVKKFNVNNTNGNEKEYQIITLSQDHKVSSEVEQERLASTLPNFVKGQQRINGISISRCLGNHFVKSEQTGMIATPYISEIVEVSSGDEIIVCSDGIWDVITPEHAFTIMESVDIENVPNELMSLAMKDVNCRDNVTVIVIRIK